MRYLSPEAASIKLTRNKITSALILVRAVQLASIVASGERKSEACLVGNCGVSLEECFVDAIRISIRPDRKPLNYHSVVINARR